MKNFTRRHFLQAMGVAGAASSSVGWPILGSASSSAKARVVIIGGGFGGASCAKYLRQVAPDIAVTLIERDSKFVTCPFSNAVLGGLYDIDYITHGYDALRDKHGVNVMHDNATAIDPIAKTVSLNGGAKVEYDRLVVSPGIDFQWGAIEGYDEAASERMPHAWKAICRT